MDRRQFFQSTAQKLGKTLVKHADSRVTADAVRWIRPPFAIDELQFLLTCTRCKACIEACPHQVVFALAPHVGVRATATPALDVTNNACRLCQDWPCVEACEPAALQISEVPAQTLPLPKLAQAHISTQACLPYSGPECGACSHSCPVDGALVWEMEKPSIDADRCVGCGQCRQACIVEPKAIVIQSVHQRAEAE